MKEPQPSFIRTVLTILVSVFFTLFIVHIFQINFSEVRMRNDSRSPPFSESADTEKNLNRSHYYYRSSQRMPSCAKGNTAARSFLIVFMSRSGSTAISQTMARHPLVDHHFEMLDCKEFLESSSEHALNHTRTVFKNSIAGGKIPGFKVRALHIKKDPKGWANLAREFDTRIIWQYRKNVFKTALGIYAREVLGDHTAIGGIAQNDFISQEHRCKNMGVGCSFKIEDWKSFHRIITARLQQDLEMVRASRILDDGRDCVYELPYEEYLYYMEDSITDLFKFLGLEVEKFETFRRKATGDSMCDVVENFDDMCNHFYGCPLWQPFLEDMENNCRCTSFNYSSGEYCSSYSEKERQLLIDGDY